MNFLPPTSSKKKISFGIMLDSFSIKRWQLLCIQKLMDEQNVELLFILLNNSQGKKINKFKKYSSSKAAYYLYEKSLGKLEMLEVVNCKEMFKNIDQISIVPVQKKWANYFSEEDVKIVQKKAPDFMLRFGFGIVRGEILTVPKFGIWSFHHGDVDFLRGGPMGIWEILLKHHHQGAILQKLTNKLDGGIILHQGKIVLAKHSARTNINSILKVSTEWPRLVCKNVLLNGEDVLPKKAVKTTAPIYKIPSNLLMLKFIFQLLKHTFIFHYHQLFRAEDWNIGILNKKIEGLEPKDISQIKWAAKNPSSIYKADPFYMNLQGEKVIFEDFDYSSQKGKISSLEIENGQIKGEKKLELQTEHHLSYPYTFVSNNKIYLLPESFTSNEQPLFKLNEKWTKILSLVKCDALVDSTICFYHNKYWLWCSKKDLLNNAGLYLYFSDTLEGDFIPHPLNPVKTNIHSARPAGTPFVKSGKLFRPSQNCSKTYGGSIVINEVAVISTTAYSEKAVKEFFPDTAGIYPKGLHTLSAAGENTLLDGKRFVFSFSNFRYQLQRKISKLVGR